MLLLAIVAGLLLGCGGSGWLGHKAKAAPVIEKEPVAFGSFYEFGVIVVQVIDTTAQPPGNVTNFAMRDTMALTGR